jgi:hypothetical protein
VSPFARIRQRWFIQGMPGFGYDTWVAESTVNGTAIAPNQYRFLMPWTDHLLASVTGVPLPTAILAADAVLLVVVLGLLHRLSQRLAAPGLMLAAAAAWAYWCSKLDHWDAEVMLLTAVVTAVTLLLLDDRPRSLLLLALGIVVCGARTDYAAGLGLVVFAVGVRRRQAVTASTGVAVAVAALAATYVLTHLMYPHAHYAVALQQWPFNLTPGVWMMVLTFYGPLLLIPAVFAAQRRALPPMVFVIAWFLVEFAATFVVGRVEESRIFMPFAPALAVAALGAWRELRRSSSLRGETLSETASASAPHGPEPTHPRRRNLPV